MQPLSTPLVPKIIHQIWIGNEPFPEKYKFIVDKWRTMHPWWDYKLWDDTAIAALELENKEFYTAGANPGEKSDIARYEILKRFGGVYVDTDFECIKSFDDLISKVDFCMAVEPVTTSPACLGNACIIAAPHHPILCALVDEIKNHRMHRNTVQRTGPWYATTVFTQYVERITPYTVILPSIYFYPRPWDKRHDPAPIHTWLYPETLGFHYWEGSWMPKKK